MLSLLASLLSIASANSLYIVTMDVPPAPFYTGGVEGLVATAPKPGNRVDTNSADVVAYCAYLDTLYDSTLITVGASAGDRVLSYHFSVSGFTASVTQEQAQALRLLDSVLSVDENELEMIDLGVGDPQVVPERRRRVAETPSRRRLQSSHVGDTGDMLGLNVQGGARDKGFDGEGIVIALVEGGIWPEHPSFADDGSYGPPPSSFLGTGCEFGNTDHNALDLNFTCNNKILASKYYNTSWPLAIPAEGFDSSRDPTGLATSMFGVAAGNMDVPATIDGVDFGTSTGLAPRARISAYKICHLITATTAGCSLADVISGLDASVADGVDVMIIPFWISVHIFLPITTSLLNAVGAGIVVSGSSRRGTDGKINAPATPWMINTAGSSTDHDYIGTLEIDGNPDVYGVNHGVETLATADLVDAEYYGNEECIAGIGFNASVAGKIILCLNDAGGRDSYLRQSQAVSGAGGVGTVLYNTDPLAQLQAGNHFVPYIHVQTAEGESIKALIGGTSIGAKINPGVRVPNAENEMYRLSGTGPSGFSEDLLKPDVTAPGINILAPMSPYRSDLTSGYLFSLVSHTLYGNAQVAGISAILKQAHPDWSPAMIKSAIITTARQDVLKADGATPADPFDFGGGHVNPAGYAKKGKAKKGSMFEPGLVYDAVKDDYTAFLCGAGYEAFVSGCEDLKDLGFSLEPSNLNLPSIAIGNLTSTQTVTRTATSVARERGWRVYTVRVDAPPGTTVAVNPTAANLKKGMTFSYSVTITVDTGTVMYDKWTFGSLTWSSDKYTVRSPIAVQPIQSV